MNIPKAFTLGGKRITVQIVSADKMRDACLRAGTFLGELPPFGLCDYEGHTIYIQRCSSRLPKWLQMQTFWHEYFHMLFWSAGRERLARDETLVDTCGALQLQALMTFES